MSVLIEDWALVVVVAALAVVVMLRRFDAVIINGFVGEFVLGSGISGRFAFVNGDIDKLAFDSDIIGIIDV